MCLQIDNKIILEWDKKEEYITFIAEMAVRHPICHIINKMADSSKSSTELYHPIKVMTHYASVLIGSNRPHDLSHNATLHMEGYR